MAQFFNRVAQADPFVLSGEPVIFIDELFRCAQGDGISDRSFDAFLAGFVDTRGRIFGPLLEFVAKQARGSGGYGFAAACDELGIKSAVAVSDLARGPGQRAARAKNCLAGAGIGLIAQAMITQHIDLGARAIEAALSEVVQAASMAHDLLLTCNGVIPATGAFGVAPEGRFGLDRATVDCDGAVAVVLARDQAARWRMIAGAAAESSVAERRLALAGRSRPLPSEVPELRAGDLADLTPTTFTE